MSIKWPQPLRDVLVLYLKRTEANRYVFTPSDKNLLSADLIAAYNGLSYQKQASFLVPASGDFLKDRAISVRIPSTASLRRGTDVYELVEMAIQYKWDTSKNAEGFVEGTDYPCSIEKGMEYDRIGGDSGRYLCPLRADGEPEGYLARAIPYYIPDESDVRSSPAYHLYQAETDFSESNGYPRCGTIAKMFRENPDDGGGKQLYLGEDLTIKDLLEPLHEGDSKCVLKCLR